jgi:hypothetical protein
MTDDPDVSVDENSEAIAKLPAFALTVGELEAESKNDAMASADSARPRRRVWPLGGFLIRWKHARDYGGPVGFGPLADNQHCPWPPSTAAHEAVIVARRFFGSACPNWRIRTWRRPAPDRLPRSL